MLFVLLLIYLRVVYSGGYLSISYSTLLQGSLWELYTTIVIFQMNLVTFKMGILVYIIFMCIQTYYPYNHISGFSTFWIVWPLDSVEITEIETIFKIVFACPLPTQVKIIESVGRWEFFFKENFNIFVDGVRGIKRKKKCPKMSKNLLSLAIFSQRATKQSFKVGPSKFFMEVLEAHYFSRRFSWSNIIKITFSGYLLKHFTICNYNHCSNFIE